MRRIYEARDPALTYTEKRVRGALDRITTELRGTQSGGLSRLTGRYKTLDDAIKEMTTNRNDLNAEMKLAAEELFDAEDEVLTRVIETVSFTITLSKAEKAADKLPTETVDYAAIVKELYDMVPELTTKIDALTKQYTTIVPPKDSPTRLGVKFKTNESVGTTLTGFFGKFRRFISSWSADYNRRLISLRSELARLR